MISPHDLVLDIECADWTTFVVGALGGVSAKAAPFVTADENALVDRVLKDGSGKTVWAHFGGRYDFLWFLDHIDRRGIEWKASMAGTNPVALQIGDESKHDSIMLRDSYRLWPVGLKKIGALLGCPKSTLPPELACSCGLTCGGYCAIRREHAPLLTPYLIQDIEVLRRALSWIAGLCDRHDIPLRTTVGATAWADAQAMLDLGPARDYINLATSRTLREGYYGGRVECYQLSAPEVWEHDVHSMYPWALASAPVPVGRPVWSRDPLSTGLDGIIWAEVFVPPTDLPPLPARAADGSLTYCHGALIGDKGVVLAWPTHELRNAITNHGARVTKNHGGYIWPREECADFRGWCDSRADLRRSYGYDSPESAWIKWLVNSLTGKFAQRPDTTEIMPWEPECICRIRDPQDCVCRDALDPRCKWWAKFGAAVPPSGHIGAAATLTGRARVELVTQLDHAGPQRVYCDTDSVYSRRPLTRRLGEDIGTWGKEGPHANWIAVAPKVYRCGVGEKVKAKCKGARMVDGSTWERFVSGDGVARAGVRGLAGALRRGDGIFQADNGVRAWRGAARPLVGSRERVGDVTRAIDLRRYAQLKSYRAGDQGT